MGSSYTYTGDELLYFYTSTNWRESVLRKARPFIKGEALEVGAGMGYFSEAFLRISSLKSLDIFEPDQKNFEFLIKHLRHIENFEENSKCQHKFQEVYRPTQKLYDVVMAMDVVEHIEDDRDFLESLSKSLKPQGVMVILVPAHMALYSDFDRSIGHFRRYNLSSFKDVLPENLSVTHSYYLDSVGMFASLWARFSKGKPNRFNLWVWDKILVRLSRILDPLLGFRMGKSLLMILEKTR